jgi:hypothetical protein
VIKPIWAAVGGLTLLGIAGGIGVFVVSSGGEEEAVQQVGTATPSAAATPMSGITFSPTASPQGTSPAETAVPVPADWQMYEDPKERFTIRIPPDWKKASFSTEDNPSWLQFNLPGEAENPPAQTTDGVKLSVSVEPKQPGETFESKAPDDPEQPRLTLDQVTVNGNQGVRAEWGPAKGFGENASAPVGYVFERGSDWILVLLSPVGPRSSEYVKTFDQLIVHSFTLS